jgi:hypothetical protein
MDEDDLAQAAARVMVELMMRDTSKRAETLWVFEDLDLQDATARHREAHH